MKHFLITAVALTAATLTTTLADDGRPGRGPRGDRGPRSGPPAAIVERFDANGDGILDADERAAVRSAIESGEITPPEGRGPAGRGHRPPPHVTARFDANGDGVLDADERAAARAAIESGEVRRPDGSAGPGPRGPEGRRNGPPPHVVERFDANGDGVLDAEEREAVHAAIESGELRRPGRPGRPGGPDGAGEPESDRGPKVIRGKRR